MPPPASNDTGTALGQDGSDWSRDLATLTFDLESHGVCGWCGSSSSIRTPSLKSAGLAVRKIWPKICVSINGPSDLDLWPFDLETGVRVASKVWNLPSKFGHVRPLGSRIIRYVRDGRTDGRQKQRLVPSSVRAGHNKRKTCLQFITDLPQRTAIKTKQAGRRASILIVCIRVYGATRLCARAVASGLL